MLKYGNDKPDLQGVFEICDVTDIFRGSDFAIFAQNIEKGAVISAVPGPECGSRAIADRMNAGPRARVRLLWDISPAATRKPAAR